MKTKCIAFPKIGQFRNLVDDIRHRATFTGLDDDGKPTYQDELPKPILSFRGTVKLHGTNASVRYNPVDGICIQSRNLVYDDPDKLSAHDGFNKFVRVDKKDYFERLMSDLYLQHKLNETGGTLVLYGEWAGKGIQRSVGIAELEKMFYVFGLKVRPAEEDDKNAAQSYWIDISEYDFQDSLVHNIYKFPNWTVEIDFNHPETCQELREITEQVEKECPVAKHFGVSGCGEGVVWLAQWKGDTYRFKIKGEKHSVSKVKNIVEIDPELMESIESFVVYAVTENRVDQAIRETNPDYEMKKMGDYIKWMANDIQTEERDVLEKSNLTWKQAGKKVSTQARKMFMQRMASV